ncbi:MAG: hypothetical protein WBW31_12635, partial [Candidatus Sulfotelmatobacter sp.]
MADPQSEPTTQKELAPMEPLEPALEETEVKELVGDQEYEVSFGEDLERTLDVDTWATGLDWEGAVARLKIEIRSAVEREETLRRIVRDELLPKLGKTPGAPTEAGVFRATPEEITKVHEGLLFPGGVEAVDGTSASHETM